MNHIFFRDFLFDDRIIRNARISLENSMVAESLAPDSFIFTLEFSSDVDSPVPLMSNEGDYLYSNEGDQLYSLGDITTLGDLLPYTYGEEVIVEHDGVMLGKFYVQSIIQRTATQFEFTCTSLVGMLATVKHYGGIYTQVVNGVTTKTSFKTIVDDIFSTAGIPSSAYTIDMDIQNIMLGNWLPIASCRDNLCQVCFPLGVSILKEADGTLHFTYNNAVDVEHISPDRIYLTNRGIDYETPATKVIVVEHGFYESTVDQTVELYNDSTTVSNKLVTFEKPCYDLQATGLTIVSSGANYAVVSGAGKLTGKEYTHTTKEVTVSTGATGEPNEKTVSEAYMVDATNSYYTALRVARYYGHVDEDSLSMTLDVNKRNFTGQLINFTDVMDKSKTGYIRTMGINLSHILKSDTVISSGFALGPFGSNYVDSLVIWSGNGEGEMEDHMLSLNGLSGIFKPSDYGLLNQRVRVIVFSSSPGGQGGFNGEASTLPDPLGGHCVPGEGGEAGTPGEGLYYTAVDMDLTQASYSATLGEGGAAGARNGGAGGALSHTTFGSISSSSGQEAGSGGYYNPVTLKTYGGAGDAGVRGGDGGYGSGYRGPSSTYTLPSAGGSVTYNGVTYDGGNPGASYLFTTSYNRRNYPNCRAGGAGGGAAVGRAGFDGGDTTDGTMTTNLGIGGNGASVPNEFFPKQSILGKGGAAGHGGGGAGTPGNYIQYNYSGDEHTYAGTQGTGGLASPGGKGADGFIVILTPIEL